MPWVLPEFDLADGVLPTVPCDLLLEDLEVVALFVLVDLSLLLLLAVADLVVTNLPFPSRPT